MSLLKSALSVEDPETAVRNAETFFWQNGGWIQRIRTHSWEALRRQGHTATGLETYKETLERFMKREKKREKDSSKPPAWEARRSWAPTESINGLLRAIADAAELPKAAKESGLNIELSQLRQARLFVQALVTTVKVHRNTGGKL